MSYWDLAQVSGELVPDRMAMSSVVPAIAAGGEPTLVPVEAADGTTVLYACQHVQNPSSPWLLAALGLAPISPGSSTTCVPAVVSSPH